VNKYDFNGMVIGLDTRIDIPKIVPPRGFKKLNNDVVNCDIIVFFEVGSLNCIIPKEKTKLERGKFKAFGNSDHLVWTHKKLGPVIDIFPKKGSARIKIPLWAWEKLDNIFDQLIIPALIPILSEKGYLALHASSLDLNGRGITIAGESGSGKSTTALTLTQLGAKLISDDITFIYRSDRKLRLCGFGEGIRTFDHVWSMFGIKDLEQRDTAGKRAVDIESMEWSENCNYDLGIIIDNCLDKDKLNKVNMLIRLFELSFSINYSKKHTDGLIKLLEEIPYISVVSAREAAELAVNSNVAQK
jgi:HPr Serine kinase C-terminal domain